VSADGWPYYREHPAAWLGDPARLGWTLAEHGAVAILRRFCWLSTTTSIKRADVRGVLRCSTRELARLLPRLESFFAIDGDRLVDRELQQQKDELAPIREARRKAARARHVQSTCSADAQPPDQTRPAQPGGTGSEAVPEPDQAGGAEQAEAATAGPGELRSEHTGPGPGPGPAPGPDPDDSVLHALERLGVGNRAEISLRMQMAQTMRAQGLDRDDCLRLIQHACNGENPAGLLRSWIQRGECAKVLATRNGRQKARR
jgi:uncharacterized protein YdaU (DUF1376 family)